LIDVKGSILAISQFTLFGDCSRGRRPSFSNAASPELAHKFFEEFLHELKKVGLDGKRDVSSAYEAELVQRWAHYFDTR